MVWAYWYATLPICIRIGCADKVGIGAISYVEYARRLFPGPGESDHEINNLTAVMRPGASTLQGDQRVC